MNESIPERNNLPENPKLSVCMIVRDEEKTLPRCLQSVKSIAYELVIVDTGSKDKTVSIARTFGAKVFHHEWRDDFAAARNECLKHATGDWVLQIDADEELVSSSIPYIRNKMVESSVLCFAAICDSGPEYQGPRFCWVLRFFRNHPGIRYSRPYHEGVEESVHGLMTEESRWQMHREKNVTIRHYGYEASRLSEKRKRGVSIMKAYVKNNPQDWHTLTMLGSACGGLGDYDEAEVYLRRALELNPDHAVANYSLGLALERKNNLDAAIHHFTRALTDNLLQAEAYVCLGGIYIQKGMLDTAITQLRKALLINPDLASAQGLIAKAQRLCEEVNR